MSFSWLETMISFGSLWSAVDCKAPHGENRKIHFASRNSDWKVLLTRFFLCFLSGERICVCFICLLCCRLIHMQMYIKFVLHTYDGEMRKFINLRRWTEANKSELCGENEATMLKIWKDFQCFRMKEQFVMASTDITQYCSDAEWVMMHDEPRKMFVNKQMMNSFVSKICCENSTNFAQNLSFQLA